MDKGNDIQQAKQMANKYEQQAQQAQFGEQKAKNFNEQNSDSQGTTMGQTGQFMNAQRKNETMSQEEMNRKQQAFKQSQKWQS